jgi:polar amino acid transport system permease protein
LITISKRILGRLTLLDLMLAVLLGGGALWLMLRIMTQVDYPWNWAIIPQYILRFDPESQQWRLGLITRGLVTTLRISFWATGLAMLIGTVAGLMRVGARWFPRSVGRIYVELIRNIPILVWIFIFYFFISDLILPAVGLNGWASTDDGGPPWPLRFLFGDPAQWRSFVSAVIALGIYEGAYITETVRAGIQSVETGQWEAASALGLTPGKRMVHVIFPQALRRILPPLTGQFISTIKDSSIVSVISIQELTFQGMELAAAALITFEVWIIIMVLYFIICLSLSLAIDRLEHHLRKEAVVR